MLKSKGMWANTLFIWAADNGGPQFEAANNYPLRGGKMTDYQGGVRVAAFATGGLIPPVVRGTRVLGAMHICDIHVTFCRLAGINDCSDDVPGLPGVDGVDISKLLFTKDPDKTAVVGNASSPRQEIVLSSAALISGEWKFILPDYIIPDMSDGPCRPGATAAADMATNSDEGARGGGTGWVLVDRDNGGEVYSTSSMCAASEVLNNTGCTTGGHYKEIPNLGSWSACCAACGADPMHCNSWTFHPAWSAINPGTCILAAARKLKANVMNATCGCVGARCSNRPPPRDPGCGYWTGPVWPTHDKENSSGFERDPGCPETGCLFHLPSDPEERVDLSKQNPEKLQELADRLAVLRRGSYQTMNYTANCDECETIEKIAATHRGFLAPACTCNGSQL